MYLRIRKAACGSYPSCRFRSRGQILTEFESVVVLSDEFYQELIAHPVPNDLDALRVLYSRA